MTRAELTDTVRHSLAEHFDVELDEVQPTTELVAELGCDSFDFVELVMELEDELDIEIDDEGVENCQTVCGLIDWLAPKVEDATQ